MSYWKHVESSWINAVGYFTDEEALEINLQNGKTLVYFGVPESLYEKMLLAESKGKFYNESVKGQFNFIRLDTPQDTDL